MNCLCYEYGVCFGGLEGWKQWKSLEESAAKLGSEYVAVVSKYEEDLDLRSRLFAAERQVEDNMALIFKTGETERRERKFEDYFH